MKKELILLLELLSFSYANQKNDFIVSYFQYKRAPYVVGFSCNTLKDNIALTKSLSDAGIYASFDKLNLDFKITPFIYSYHLKVGVIFDLQCYNAKEIDYLLSTASSLFMYGEPYYWLLLTDNLDDAIAMLNDTEYSLSTDLAIAVVDDQKIFMYDVFNHCKYRGGRLNVTELGSWSSFDGLNITLTQSKFSRRANYHGMVLRMVGLYYDKPDDVPIETYIYDYETKQNDTMQKFTNAVWRHIAELFNFTIEIVELPAKRIINRNAPIVKALSDRTAEISGTTAQIYHDRVNVISPSPMWPLRTCFMFRTTQSKTIKINHFLRPLANAAWYLTILCMILAILVFASALITEHGDKFERYSNSILFTIGSLCQQGTDLQVTSAPSRIALLQTMIFSLLLYNYYSASVVSARLSEPLLKINDSLNELAKLNLKFAAEPVRYFNFYIKRSDWEGQQFYNRRWVKVPDKEKFFPASEGIRRVLEGGTAYHIDVNVAYPVIERTFENQQVCQLTMVHLVPPTDSSILTALNNSFVEMMRVGSARIRETGIRARLINKWAARTPRCRTDIVVIDPLTIYEVAPAFLLLVFGMVLGPILCSFELLLHWKQLRHYRVFFNKFHGLRLRSYLTALKSKVKKCRRS